MKITNKFSSLIPYEGGERYLLNGCGDVAATLKTSNHRELNIIAPEGGRGEMGIIEVIYENKNCGLLLEEPDERSCL